MGKDDKNMHSAPLGLSDGPANVDLKQDALSRLLRRLSQYGGDELEMKLDAINKTLDSLEDLDAGSVHLADGPKPRSQDELAQVCPSWSAFAADLPRRLELLEELKNVPFRKYDGSWERMDQKKVTPYAWAAFQVAPIEGLEKMLENVRGGFFAWGFMHTILACFGGQLPRLIKLCNSGLVPELDRIPQSESSSECSATRTMERDSGVCVVTGTPDAQAYHVFPFRAIRHASVVCKDLKLVGHFWGYGLVGKFVEALGCGAKGLDSPKNMVTLNRWVRQRWDRAQATLEPVSSASGAGTDTDTDTDNNSLRLRWCFLPEVRRLGKRKRPFKWRNDLAQDPREVFACLHGSENEVLQIVHKETLRLVHEGREVVIKAEGEGERPDEWLWRLRHMTTCMAALVAAATPEGVGEEDSEMDDMDRKRLIWEWTEKTERETAGTEEGDDSGVNQAE